MEHVIEQQVAGQSGQEGILTDAFNQMDAKISKVAALAKSIDGAQFPTTAHSATTFTVGMRQDMQNLHTQVNGMAAYISTGINKAMGPVSTHALKTDESPWRWRTGPSRSKLSYLN